MTMSSGNCDESAGYAKYIVLSVYVPSATVAANRSVVGVGTAVTVLTPLNAGFGWSTRMRSPTERVWFTLVVSCATLFDTVRDVQCPAALLQTLPLSPMRTNPLVISTVDNGLAMSIQNPRPRNSQCLPAVPGIPPEAPSK